MGLFKIWLRNGAWGAKSCELGVEEEVEEDLVTVDLESLIERRGVKFRGDQRVLGDFRGDSSAGDFRGDFNLDYCSTSFRIGLSNLSALATARSHSKGS